MSDCPKTTQVTLRVLDLFSGIGGFSLGLEATGGFRTAAFCECNPYARRVLAKHWPEVKRYHDVRTLTAERLAASGIAADVVAGGFPCQDISAAGNGAGLEGARSGLWREMRRIIGEVRPRWVIAENVPRLRTLGADEVLGDLAALGYAAWPLVVGALHAGAPHIRQRVWIVAHPDADGERRERVWQPQHDGIEGASWREPDGLRPRGRRARPCLADAAGVGRPQGAGDGREGAGRADAGNGGSGVPYANGAGLAQRQPSDAGGARPDGWANPFRGDWWTSEPAVGRVAHGVPDRVDRLRCLGNAVVPAVVKAVGEAILAVEAAELEDVT